MVGPHKQMFFERDKRMKKQASATKQRSPIFSVQFDNNLYNFILFFFLDRICPEKQRPVFCCGNILTDLRDESGQADGV